MDEGKELFLDHLRRTDPGEVTKARFAVTSSGFDGTKHLVTVSHLAIDAGAAPRIRKRVLSRFEDFDRLRFLLDHSIDLAEDPRPGVLPSLDVRVAAWDTINEKPRELPFEPFMAFPQTSIRLMDQMLPVPGLVSSWRVTLGGAGTPADPRCRILELRLLDPLPAALSPGLETIRMHLDEDDLRLHRVEQTFRDGRARSILLSTKAAADGALVPVIETRGLDGGWTKLELLGSRVAKLKPEQLTRDRAERDTF